ncbi:M15 family metallopeptidase [Frigidibacter sp. MR17.14]|uniref:M15 family metallopeptidase n=1 Tax=Frigidibacter sp. MR17.14 TaxID=3126509 RepID=UPI00301302E0
MLDGAHLTAGSVTTTARLNLREGAPRRSAPVRRVLDPGTAIVVQEMVRGDEVAGNDIWFRCEGEGFVWSGGCSTLEPAVPAEPPQTLGAVPAGATRLRADGTILPLDIAGLHQVFGRFSYTEAAKGAIRIDQAWVGQNIVTLETPLLEDVGYPRLYLHRKAAPVYEAVLDDIRSAGLAGLLLTCAGTFVPRHKNHNPAYSLSSHSWGVAIDFNARWNGVGVTPPLAGEHGSLRPLVPIFAAHGFAWGGHFSGKSVDGMHFELARTDL